MRVFIAGGEPDMVAGNLARNLNQEGIEIGRHTPTAAAFNDIIPTGCEGVIVIRDMISHPYYYRVNEAARKAGVPFACIPRKWSTAQQVLRVQGFLKPVNGKIPPPAVVTEEDLREVGVAYLQAEREGGRIPATHEIVAALRRAFGSQLLITSAQHRDWTSRAIRASVEKTVWVGEAPANAPTPGTTLAEWIQVAIEEDPSRLGDVPRLLAYVTDLLGAASPELEVEVQRQVAHWRELPASEPAKRALMEAWLRSDFQTFQKTGTGYPATRAIQAASQRLFRILYPHSYIKAVRAQVFGEWARELIGLPSAVAVLAQRGIHTTKQALRDMIQRGTLHGILTKGARPWEFTSVAALDICPVFRPAPVPVSEQPVPAPVPKQPIPVPPVETAKPEPQPTESALETRIKDLEKENKTLEQEVHVLQARMDIARQDIHKLTTREQPLQGITLQTLLDLVKMSGISMTFTPVAK